MPNFVCAVCGSPIEEPVDLTTDPIKLPRCQACVDLLARYHNDDGYCTGYDEGHYDGLCAAEAAIATLKEDA